MPAAGMRSPGTVDREDRVAEPAVLNVGPRKRRDGERDVVLIDRRHELQTFPVKFLRKCFRTARRVFARIVFFADQSIVPNERIRKHILPGVLHVCAEPVEHRLKICVFVSEISEIVPDRRIFKVDPHRASPAIDRFGRRDASLRQRRVQRVDPDL